MRKRVKFGFLKSFAAVSGIALMAMAPKAAMADNLTDAMVGAYRTSGLLEQNRALLRIQDENVAAAVARLRPVIDWVTSASYSYSRNTSGVSIGRNEGSLFSTSLDFSWLLFDNGASQLRQLSAQEAVLSTRQSLLNVEQQVLFSAVSVYINVLLQQETVALRRNNLRLLQEELKAAQDRFEVGEVTRTDVALAESRVAAAQASLTQSRGDLLTAEAEYAEVVGNAPGSIAGQPSLPQRAASLQSAETIAVRNHPSLLSQQHAVKSAEYSASAASKDLGPNLRAGGSVGWREDIGGSRFADGEDASVSLTLTQPVFRGGALASARRSALASVDAEKGNLITVQRGVVQDVSAAYVALETARASLVSAGERVRAAQVAFDGIREEATLGARTTLDVLQSEQELLDAQTSRVQARANQAIAAFGLLQAQGLLTAGHLELPVEIYDPTVYYNIVKSAPHAVSTQGSDLDRVMKALGKQ